MINSVTRNQLGEERVYSSLEVINPLSSKAKDRSSRQALKQNPGTLLPAFTPGLPSRHLCYTAGLQANEGYSLVEFPLPTCATCDNWSLPWQLSWSEGPRPHLLMFPPHLYSTNLGTKSINPGPIGDIPSKLRFSRQGRYLLCVLR